MFFWSFAHYAYIIEMCTETTVIIGIYQTDDDSHKLNPLIDAGHQVAWNLFHEFYKWNDF